MRTWLALAALLAGSLVVGSGQAASLQLSPVSIDLAAPAQAASINLHNTGDQPVNVQVRAYRWSQPAAEGEDALAPTQDVVASPPAATVPAGATYTIRVARLAGRPVKGEESYRLLIDELPPVNIRRPNNAVSLVVRYSVPVFFNESAAGSELTWAVSRGGGGLVVQATNKGDRHARIADLVVAAPSGQVTVAKGLAGYVLPGATKRWIVRSGAGRIQQGATVTITATGGDYAINQRATVASN